MHSFDPFDHFGFLTNRLARLINHRFEPDLSATGYHFPISCLGILADLWKRDGVSQRELGMSLIKTKSSITKMLGALAQAKLIVKKNDPTDKRNKLIFLTKKGKDFRRQIEVADQSIEQNLLKEISPEEINITKKVLKSMYFNLSKELNKTIIHD